MVQGYPASCGGGCGRWPSLNRGRGKAGRGGSCIQGNSREGYSHPVGLAYKQRAPFASGELKLREVEAPRGEAGGSMLSVSGPEKFYYLRNWTCFAGCDEQSFFKHGTVVISSWINGKVSKDK